MRRKPFQIYFPLLCFLLILALEFFDSSGGVHQLLFTGEKRVAGRTDFNFLITDRVVNLKSISAGTGNGPQFILGMDSFLHYGLLF